VCVCACLCACVCMCVCAYMHVCIGVRTCMFTGVVSVGMCMCVLDNNIHSVVGNMYIKKMVSAVS
jgi:hypothetical protein